MKNNREYILRKQSDFNLIYNRGKSSISKNVVVLHYRNKKNYIRTAFVASKKVGNSVKRNRARRLMKESYKKIKENVVIGYDIIFVARNNIIEKNEKEVEKSMYGAMKTAGLIKKSENN